MALKIGGEPVVLAEGDEGRWPLGGTDVSGDLAVYSVQGTIYAVDLVSGATREIHGGRSVRYPTTNGRYVFWSNFDLANPLELRADLRGYDLASNSSFAVVHDLGWNVAAEARGDALVWQRGNTARAVHAIPIDDALPSARRQDPGQVSPQWLFVPETGHYLWGMRPFWDGNGGLPMFGYPLTEEFWELNADPGTVHEVRYLERQRFERHPELAGTPYEIMIGRLGAEKLAREGRDWQTFSKADPSSPHYFVETGHAIAKEFWNYWSSHGLDLGDQGVSAWESVALFGFPISPAMVESNADGHTVLTQYFERAVFEHHPENQTPHDVLLRRLSVTLLEARGW